MQVIHVALCCVLAMFVASVAAAIAGMYNKEKKWARAVKTLGWAGIAISFFLCCVTISFAVMSSPDLLSGIPGYPSSWLETPTPTIAPHSPSAGQGYLGIVCKNSGGAKVVEVIPGSPAEKAGILPGDVITFVDKEFVPYCPELAQIISQKAGETVTVSLVRKGEVVRVIVEIEER